MEFANLGLSAQLTRTLAEQGYHRPTPIQSQAIPAILAGGDVVATAQTGTGKTAAFLLPVLQRLAGTGSARANRVRCLVLAPTRELACQVRDSAIAYGKGLNLHVVAAFGGVAINPQMMQLRRGADVLVATPGRLLDLSHANAVRFDGLETLVLDEADKMLNLGFAEELGAILKLLPAQRQNLMFSATFSPDIRDLARTLCPDAVDIAVSPANRAAPTVRQWLCPVDKKKKPQLLTALLRRNGWRQVLVFVKTRDGADRLCGHLQGAGFPAAALHGDKSQSARARALGDFKAGTVDILVATDIAARGLDIDNLPQVVNFDLPKVAEDYIHRIGRTGRAGDPGEAVSLVCADEFELLNAVEQLLGKHIPREEEPGFEPRHNVPESRPIVGKRKPKKPKKPKAQDQPRGAAGTAATQERHKPRKSANVARPGGKPGQGGQPGQRPPAGKTAPRGRGAGGRRSSRSRSAP